MRMRKSELLYLEKNPGLWRGVARRNRLDRDPAINKSEDLGLIYLKGGAYYITKKGQDIAHEPPKKSACPACKRPF